MLGMKRKSRACYLLSHSPTLSKERHPNRPGSLTAQPGFPLPSLTLMMTASFPTPLRMLYQMPVGEADGSVCGLVWFVVPRLCLGGPNIARTGAARGPPPEMLGKAQRSPGNANALAVLCCHVTLWAVYEFQGLDTLVPCGPGPSL